MKTLIIALTAIAIGSVVLSAQPPGNSKAQEPAMPMILSSREGSLSEPVSQRPVGSQSGKSNTGDAAALKEADSLSETISSNPTALELGQNFPNPFNSDTEIKYGLPERSSVQISVYNIFGQKVRTIKDAIEDPGYYSVNWDGRDDHGDVLASGMYFYIFASDDNYITRKMMLLK